MYNVCTESATNLHSSCTESVGEIGKTEFYDSKPNLLRDAKEEEEEVAHLPLMQYITL
jgi:hypothetical protein